MKLSRFLLADDPMTEGSPVAIVHTIGTPAIIEIVEGHVHCDTPYRHYLYEDELYTFRVHHLFTREFDGEKHHIIVTKLLDDAWDWFESYMRWEDEQP